MKLREIMIHRGLTVAQLAEMTGLNPRTVEQYSSGRRPLRNAQGHALVTIADALGVHPRELIEEKKEG